jgi:hypothetical protein
MSLFKYFDFSLSQCDFTDMFEESHRFLLHIFLMHCLNYIIDRKEQFLGREIFKTLSVTLIAIIVYNIIFKKNVMPNIKKLKKACLIPYDLSNTSVVATYGIK